jgi:hypothetical protein
MSPLWFRVQVTLVGGTVEIDSPTLVSLAPVSACRGGESTFKLFASERVILSVEAHDFISWSELVETDSWEFANVNTVSWAVDFDCDKK